MSNQESISKLKSRLKNAQRIAEQLTIERDEARVARDFANLTIAKLDTKIALYKEGYSAAFIDKL